MLIGGAQSRRQSQFSPLFFFSSLLAVSLWRPPSFRNRSHSDSRTVELHERQLPVLRFLSASRATTRDDSARESALHVQSFLAGRGRIRTMSHRHRRLRRRRCRKRRWHHFRVFPGNALSRVGAHDSRRRVADEFSESGDDPENQQPIAQRSNQVDCRSLRCGMAVRGLGSSGPNSDWPHFRTASRGMASGGAGATGPRDPRNTLPDVMEARRFAESRNSCRVSTWFVYSSTFSPRPTGRLRNDGREMMAPR